MLPLWKFYSRQTVAVLNKSISKRFKLQHKAYHINDPNVRSFKTWYIVILNIAFKWKIFYKFLCIWSKPQQVRSEVVQQEMFMNFMKTCPSVTFYFMKNSFSDISRKWILPNMIRAGTDCTDCNGQFTPKMKANAKPRLLSSLV